MSSTNKTICRIGEATKAKVCPKCVAARKGANWVIVYINTRNSDRRGVFGGFLTLEEAAEICEANLVDPGEEFCFPVPLPRGWRKIVTGAKALEATKEGETCES